MTNRCDNPNFPQYADYGGRGIVYTEEWRQLANFVAWVKTQFPPDGLIPRGLQIERRDNDGSYSPENCYFATRKQQANNKRNNRRLTLDGRTQTATQWEEERGLKRGLIYMRLERGWSVEDAINLPIQKGGIFHGNEKEVSRV